MNEETCRKVSLLRPASYLKTCVLVYKKNVNYLVSRYIVTLIKVSCVIVLTTE